MSDHELVQAAKTALLRDGLDAWGAMGARQMAERVIEAVEPMIRAEERKRLRRSAETLGGYIRKSDEYVPIGVVLMLFDHAEQ